MSLVEITNLYKNYETGGEVTLGGYGSSIRDILALGHRLGFVGGTDSHRGRPGSRLSNQSTSSVIVLLRRRGAMLLR